MASPEGFVDKHGNPIPLPPDVWEATHPQAQAFILLLLERVRVLEEQVTAMQEQLRSNSSNSSRPPSSDPPGLPSRKRTPTGRRPGGQKGHPGHGRKLVP